MWRRLLLSACLLAAVGCAATPKPDLARLYQSARQAPAQPPVILIHGVMGARLQDPSGREIWLGPVTKLLVSAYRELALPIDAETLEPQRTELVPHRLTDAFAGRDFYRSITQVLEQAGGYRRYQAGEPVPPDARAYYVFLYDWRQDNQKTAAALDRFVEQILLDHGQPELKVDIVAHSMGGLIARYYMRYGDVDVLDGNEFPVNNHGAKRVRKVVLLGTPNLGSMESVRSFINGRRLGLRHIPTEVLATMPSLYQLFPHAINTWLVTNEGRALDRDLFDVKIWRRFEWSVFDPKTIARIRAAHTDPKDADAYLATLQRYFHKHLERARRFVWSLTVPVEDPVPLIVFGGDCALTPARLLVEEIDGRTELRLWPREVINRVPGIDYETLMLEPGDGTVTKASLLARDALDPSVPRHQYSFFPLDYAFFLCEPHDSLTANVSFQDNLLHALLSRD